MRESSLWAWLSKPLPCLDMTRVENLLDEGTPDVEGCLSGAQFWCELKVADRPARPTTAVRTQAPVKQSQIDWLKRRWLACGNAWLLVQVGTHHEARRYLLPGYLAHLVRDGIPELELSRLCASDPDGDAESIIRRMTRH